MSRNTTPGGRVPAANLEKTLRQAARKYGNNYALSKESGVPASVILRFIQGGPEGKGSDIRLSTASKLAAALGFTLFKD
jgi:hypothetical protein